MGDFFGLNVALSALRTQQQGLTVTGHNIANVNTVGYTRQRIDMRAESTTSVASMHAQAAGAGAGVSVEQVMRMKDDFIEARSLAEHGDDALLSRSAQILSRIEMAFAEPGDNSIQAQLADLWAGWDDVANNPQDVAARIQLVERARTLTTGIGTAAADLAELRGQSVEQLKAEITAVNAAAARVAQLNESIRTISQSGLPVNDLLDQRDKLVGELADRIGVITRPGEDGMINVFVGGTAIVRGESVLEMEVDDTAGIASVRYTVNNAQATVDGGEVGALLGAVNDILPRYAQRLDDLAVYLRDTRTPSTRQARAWTG